MPNANKLLHFHLPKTGGTAIRHHLVNQLGESDVTRALAGVRMADALIEWEQMTAISGHFSLRQGDKLPSDRYSFTVLRDPLDRFLSEFYFSKVDNSSRPLDGRTHTLDLDAFLHSLTEKECQAFPAQLEMLYCLGTDSQSTLSQNERLLAALNALECFDSVAIQEELEDFTCMLDSEFGWPCKPPPRINVTSYRLSVDELSAPQRNRLKQLLEPEIELYQCAKELFKKHRRQLLSQTRLATPVDTETATTEPVRDTTTHPALNFGDLRCSIKSVKVSGAISGDERVMVGEQFSITIEFEAQVPISSLNIGIAIKDERGVLIFGTNSMLLGEVFSLAPGIYISTFRMLSRMPIGGYRISAALMPTESHYDGCYHWIDQVASFDVYDVALTTFEGKILMDAQVEVTPTSRSGSCTSSPYITANRAIKAKARENPPLTDFRAKITPMCSPDVLQSGSEVLLPVQLKNKGKLTWPAFGLQPVTLSYRWFTTRGAMLVADGLRTLLPNDVNPGESIALALQVKVPDVKGTLLLTVSLVQEDVVWFMERKTRSAHTFELTVI